jgi:hypothetical protein
MPQIMEAKVNPSPLSDLDHGPSEEILPIPVRNVEDELAPLYLPAQDRPGCLIQRHGPAPAALLSNAFLYENLSSSPSSALYEAHSRGNMSKSILEARTSARPLLDSNICTVTASQDYCPYFSNLHSFPLAQFPYQP